MPVICELTLSLYESPGVERRDLASNWTSCELALNRDSSHALADYFTRAKLSALDEAGT